MKWLLRAFLVLVLLGSRSSVVFADTITYNDVPCPPNQGPAPCKAQISNVVVDGGYTTTVIQNSTGQVLNAPNGGFTNDYLAALQLSVAQQQTNTGSGGQSGSGGQGTNTTTVGAGQLGYLYGTANGAPILAGFYQCGVPVGTRQCPIGAAQVAHGSNCSWIQECKKGTPGDREECNPRQNIHRVCCKQGSGATAPALTSPADNVTLNTSHVLLKWSKNANWGDDCGDAVSHGLELYIGINTSKMNLTTGWTPTPIGNNTQFTYDGNFVPGSCYYWRVTARAGKNTYDTPIRKFCVSNNVTGIVYYDTTNTCSSSNPWTSGSGMSITSSAGGSSAVSGANGTFALNTSSFFTDLTLSGIPSGYQCSTGSGCSANCPTQTNVAVPGSGRNFYVSAIPVVVSNSAWWQVQGAPVYAGSIGGGVTVTSLLPSTQKLILPDAGGKSGTLLRGSGTTNLGSGTVSSDLWTTLGLYKGKKMDYSYFGAQMGVIKGQASDWGTDTITLPVYSPSKDFWYSEPTSGTTTISSPWTVGVGEKYVVFVNGDLRISNNITVANGGFLAFIVKGKVVVAPGVTSMQGMYIAGSNFETESVYVDPSPVDTQLNVEGNVIAWGELKLTRNLGATNNTTPGEKFTFRPDLLTNMPAKMKTFAMQWSEVAPGTFGN